MARLLYFRNQLLADQVIRMVVASGPASPPSIGVGVFFDSASIASQERNYIKRRTFLCSMVKSNELTFEEAADYIQGLVGLQGTVEVKDGAVLKMRMQDWFLESAPPPDTGPGIGGRFIAEWPLTFIGVTPIERF